jgi:hypothetical protein
MVSKMSHNTNISKSIEELNFVHSTIQELENLGIELPMGDYNLIYKYLEDARELLEDYELELFSQLND